MKAFLKYLTEALSKNPELILEDINVQLPFVYKNKGIYLNDIRIGNIIKDQSGNNILAINQEYSNTVIENEVSDYFYDIDDKDLIENKIFLININTLDIYNIKTETDSSIDSIGDEYSYLYAEKYDVYFGDININNILNSNNKIKIQERIDDHLNKNYKSKYYGSHRTY